MGKIANTWEDAKKIANDPTIKTIAGFIAGKNAAQIGQWLVKLGKALSAGKTGAVTKLIAGTGLKLAGVGAAAYIAYKEVVRMNKESKIIANKDIPGLEKIARIALEMWPPTMAVRSIDAAWKWLTKKPSQISKKDSKSVQANSQSSMDSKTAAMTASYDAAAKAMGMVDRPTHPQAENEWQKEVGRNMNKKNNPSKQIGTKGNGPEWYFQGLASKLAGTNLTWTGVKTADRYPFVATCGIHVVPCLPIEGGTRIHSQMIANAEIEFQALRGKNTGAFNYGVREVFLYDLQLSSCIVLYRYIRKILSMVNNTDPQLVYLPQKLLSHAYPSASKTCYTDITLNKSNYITKLNSLGKVINSYAFKGRTLNSRWNYLADKCIKDYNGEKAIYGVYIITNLPYVDTDADNTIKYYGTESQGVTQLLGKLEDMINAIPAIAGDKGAGVLLKVAGDMIKLLGASVETFNNVPYCDGTEKLEFVYDPEAVDQIRNAKMIPVYGVNTITDTFIGTSGQKLQIPKSTLATSNSTNIINPQTVSIVGPDEEWVVVSDRNKEFSVKENAQMIQFCANFKPVAATSASSINIEIRDCGTSLLEYISICDATVTDNPTSIKYPGIVSIYNGTNNAHLVFGAIPTIYGTAADAYTRWVNYLTQIDFAPRYQLAFVNSTGAYLYQDWLDVDNYSIMTAWQFNQFNNVAVYSQTFVFTPDQVKIASLLE